MDFCIFCVYAIHSVEIPSPDEQRVTLFNMKMHQNVGWCRFACMLFT